MAIIQNDCPYCGTKSVAFSIVHQQQCTKTDPCLWDVLATCARCSRGVIIAYRVPENVKPASCVEHPNRRRLVQFVSVFPSPPNTEAPEYTPDNVANYFRQAKDSQNNGNWDAAGAMFGKALEIALKEKFPDIKGKLNVRIQKAADDHKLTAELAGWAHHVRILRNEAVHDEEPLKQEDVEDVEAFAHVILQYLFTLPGELEEARDRRKGAQEVGNQN